MRNTQKGKAGCKISQTNGAPKGVHRAEAETPVQATARLQNHDGLSSAQNVLVGMSTKRADQASIHITTYLPELWIGVQHLAIYNNEMLYASVP